MLVLMCATASLPLLLLLLLPGNARQLLATATRRTSGANAQGNILNGFE
jgi:hypothetical protein